MANETKWEKVEREIDKEFEDSELDAEDSYLQWEQLENG